MQAIRTAGLTKYYGRARGIEKLDLTVEEGEFFGFIGPNGAGKSTTIRTLLGLIRPTSGSASVLGLDIEKDRQRILSQVGYLPAEAAFYPGMRVGEVLRLSAGLRGRDCRGAAEELCSRLHITIVMVLHDMNFTARYSDWVYVLKQGRVFDHGRPDSILVRDTMKEVFHIDSQIIRDDKNGCPFLIPEKL